MTEPHTPDVAEPMPEDYEAAAAEVRAELDADDESAAAEPHDAPTDDDQRPDDTTGNEAAKYRKRLRATEAERDTLVGRLESLQRSEIERLAAGHLVDAADFWRDGATVADVLGEDGNVDPAKVTAVAGAVLQNHSHWGAFKKVAIPPRGLQSGSSAAPQRRAASWADEIRAAVGRGE
ncbi:MAG: hypothetical protein QOJ80_1410 [Mycobacterium sp.]|jgi:hypothetical protein|nr:hypothetical protein [Mycobacterium sp.]